MDTRKQTATITALTIERAGREDLANILGLLERNNLPLDGFSEHIETSLVARRNTDSADVVGNATLELYGPYALLRSVAVDQRERGTGLGQRLTRAALDLASERQIRAVYLLTETAGTFFPRFGFRPVSRGDVPPQVRRSVEFTSACPTSALVMKLDLAGEE